MDDYPKEYVAANRPLVVFSGFEIRDSDELYHSQRSGFKISTELPPVRGSLAGELLDELTRLDYDPDSGKPYALTQNGSAVVCYHVKATSREYWLPCRKASPQAVPVDSSYGDQVTGASQGLHSPLSPLTASSELHPDGLMTPAWHTKHQRLIPAALVSVFSLTADTSSDTLNDNILKNEINSVTKKLEDSRQRVHHAVVVLGNDQISDPSSIDERLSNIRKASKLDAKNGFFYLPHEASREKTQAFVESLFGALKEPCMEHFRDLTRHARRKRDRGAQAPSTPVIGFAKPLTQAGWRVRFEYKLGIFAEFRREYETAERHFTTALEGLLDTGGVFELTSNWSPRFNQHRLLVDVIALHLAKSYLMRGMSTSAVRFWCQHKSRVKIMIDKQGKGTRNYGWKAWEARWARVFAQLIVLTPVSQLFHGDSKLVYLTQEKSGQQDERVDAWEFLHHSGYWYWKSALFSMERRDMAAMIPEDDRVPPGQSPATKNARRKEMYDDYLCPDPHDEFPVGETKPQWHMDLIQKSLEEAIEAFTAKDQPRMRNYLRYILVEEAQKSGSNSKVLIQLRELWDEGGDWRSSQWLGIMRSVGELLHNTAAKTGDIETRIRALWELSVDEIRPIPNLTYDLAFAMESETERPISIHLEGSHSKSPVKLETFFRDAEGHAGEPLGMYLIISSKAHINMSAVTLSSLTIRFDGAIQELSLSHENSQSAQRGWIGDSAFTKVDVDELTEPGDGEVIYAFNGTTSLEIGAGQNVVLGITMIAREPGHLTPLSASMRIEQQDVCLLYEQSLARKPPFHRVKVKSLPSSRFYKERQTLRILPKLAKMEIYVPNQRPTYYVDELATLCIEVTNKEHATAAASLEVRVNEDEGVEMAIRKTDSNSGDKSDSTKLLHFNIGELKPDEVHKSFLNLKLPSSAMEAGLEMRLNYRLSDDPDTPISKSFTAVLVVLQPFQTSMKLEPCYHPEPWPSYFELLDDVALRGSEHDGPEIPNSQPQSSSSGYQLKSKWSLNTLIKSVAQEPILISKAQLKVDEVQGDGICTQIEASFDLPIELTEGVESPLDFTMELRRTDAAERKMVAVFPKLLVHWRRANDVEEQDVQTLLPVPRLAFPTAEPRALATRIFNGVDEDLIQIDYTLENPSMHLLTFNLTMELNEDFAFSGPKSTDVGLVPLSRHTVTYTFTPLVQGAFIQPRLKVLDVFFNRSLPVQGTKGLKSDADGIHIWVKPNN